MKAIIGLGNPELKYKNTRHNTGFLIMDEILKNHQITLSDKFNSYFGKKGDILYLLPKTYMNLSGKAVIELMNFYKLKPTDLLIIYDDVSLEFGTFRLKKDGNHGGHNGIKSIINCIGTNVFDRLKVGIGPIPNNFPLENFVLSNFSQEELKDMEKMGKIAIDLVDCWIKDGIEKAQNKYNGKVI